MTTISPPIQRMIDATNAEDRAAFVDCFTDDAHLEDWGRAFDGRAGVARWDESDNIGRHARFEALAERIDGDSHVVTLVVNGGGFNGTSDIAFRLEGDRISQMVISAD
jgi:hypothetical protein